MPGDLAGEETRGEVLWTARLDSGYQLRVETTTDQRTGRLMLIHIGTGAVLLDAAVALPAGAIYGLDAETLKFWRRRGWHVLAKRIQSPFRQREK